MPLQDVREMLHGYLEPEQKRWADRPIGKTGLTVRISSILYLQALACMAQLICGLELPASEVRPACAAEAS